MSKIVTTLLAIFFSITLSQTVQIVHAAQADKIQSITIQSQWGGLGTPSQDKLIINNRGGRYRTNRGEIKAERVDALLAAINRIPADSSKLTGFGITEEWLNINASIAFQENISSVSAKQEELFKRSFVDPKLIAEVVNQLSAGGTDDNPSIEVEIVFADSQRLHLDSQNQGPFMAPWTISDGQNTRISYNADISRALAQLLPKKFTNRERLEISDQQWRGALSENLVNKIGIQWDKLDCEAKISRYLDQVSDEYTIKAMRIGSISSIDVNGTESWMATLQSKKLPANFVIGVSLPFKNNELIGFSQFQNQMDQFIQRTLAVPWLNSYLAAHPKMQVEIRFVADRSLSAYAVKSFQEDMIAAGKKDLIDKLADQLADATFLQIDDEGCFTRWLILPDQRMVLWHFRCDPILNWHASDFHSVERYGWNCPGAVISPDGNILQR